MRAEEARWIGAHGRPRAGGRASQFFAPCSNGFRSRKDSPRTSHHCCPWGDHAVVTVWGRHSYHPASIDTCSEPRLGCWSVFPCVLLSRLTLSMLKLRERAPVPRFGGYRERHQHDAWRIAARNNIAGARRGRLRWLIWLIRLSTTSILIRAQ